jgi:protein TonB
VEPRCQAGVQAFNTNPKEGRMRGWTLGVSIVIHLCVITGVIVKPLFATDELPEPPSRTVYEEFTTILPEPPVLRRTTQTPVPSQAAFPTTAPDNVIAEPPEVPRPVDPIDFSIGGTNNGPSNGFLPSSAGLVAGNDLPPVPEVAPVKPIRVGGDIRPPQKIRDVPPRYPPIAQASRVEGVVILEATIDEDGSVRDVRVLRGKPLLDDAAAEAVRQWRFTPTRLNGEAVPVVMTVTVSFQLN